jgi:FtsP/CotA-like multicopper oxidase with cupredoxin domain
MATRRDFLKAGATTGAGLYFTSRLGFLPSVYAQVPGGTLPPGGIPRFRMPMVIPPAMRPTNTSGSVDFYRIAMRQFEQQILPPSFAPMTTVWGYGSIDHPESFFAPASTIEARYSRTTRVKWINQLVDDNGRFLPHLFSIDQTLHWANPKGGIHGRDSHGTNQAPYRGPVPTVTHLHGGHTFDDSDGYAEAWYLPRAKNIPAGYATEGTWYDLFRSKAALRQGGLWEPGTATYDYSNDQAATTLWIHDHTLGMTRANVYAGPCAFYLIRGGPGDLTPGLLPGPAPAVGDSPSARRYEIPIVIQDRSFNDDGSLFYPSNRAFFEGLDSPAKLQIPFIPEPGCTGPSDVSPIWNPEFFGNTMVVNGRTWPFLEVEQRRYRFRFLNACNSRFLILKMDRKNLPFWQIGSDGGFLPAPVELDQLLMAPAERADVIVDFSRVPVGTSFVLQNIAPDEPFGGGVPGIDFEMADPGTTGGVLQFRVVPAKSVDISTRPDRLALPGRAPLSKAQVTRQISLNELSSFTVNVVTEPDGTIRLACGHPDAVPFGPTEGLLGTLNADGTGNPLEWMDPMTENPKVGATEIWEISNFTEDAHPVHIHQVQFQILNREDANGVVRQPEAWENGGKDTVIAYPGEITRVKARFDFAGQYVWHCHILEHEDNGMMRPFAIGRPQNPTMT